MCGSYRRIPLSQKLPIVNLFTGHRPSPTNRPPRLLGQASDSALRSRELECRFSHSKYSHLLSGLVAEALMTSCIYFPHCSLRLLATICAGTFGPLVHSLPQCSTTCNTLADKTNYSLSVRSICFPCWLIVANLITRSYMLRCDRYPPRPSYPNHLERVSPWRSSSITDRKRRLQYQIRRWSSSGYLVDQPTDLVALTVTPPPTAVEERKPPTLVLPPPSLASAPNAESPVFTFRVASANRSPPNAGSRNQSPSGIGTND